MRRKKRRDGHAYSGKIRRRHGFERSLVYNEKKSRISVTNKPAGLHFYHGNPKLQTKKEFKNYGVLNQ
jgi:hypothetical protein